MGLTLLFSVSCSESACYKIEECKSVAARTRVRNYHCQGLFKLSLIIIIGVNDATSVKYWLVTETEVTTLV